MTAVEIVTSAHWEGDPRLRRHIRYLGEAGHEVSLVSFSGQSRLLAMGRAILAVLRSTADLVLLPDPELFLVGSLLARLRGKRAVIDIHENYAQATVARAWVPVVARPFVRVTADLAVRTGRWAAWRVMVAADELARSHDFVALNIPDPATLEFAEHDGSKRLVYVGDLTTARGAIEMVELLTELDEKFELRLVGSVSPSLAEDLRSRAEQLGVAERIEMTGRLEHEDAWAAARGSLAGLNLLRPMPAYREAVATKLWEYLAAGIPPIVSDLPGQARLIQNLDGSLVCGSVTEAAATVSELSREPERRADLGRRGRRLVEEAWESRRPDLVIQSIVEP